MGEGKAERYRKLAAEARAEAERVTIPQAKQVLLDIVYSYERLADTLRNGARVILSIPSRNPIASYDNAQGLMCCSISRAS